MGRKQKSIEDKKKKLSISISEENYIFLNQENKSKLINWLLVEYFNKFKPDEIKLAVPVKSKNQLIHSIKIKLEKMDIIVHVKNVRQ